MSAVLKVQERTGEGQRCAYCREALADRAVPCPDCATALHAECWWELASCPTIGCKRDADFVERPRRYRDPAAEDEEPPGKRFQVFRAPAWRREEAAAADRGPGRSLTVVAALCFALIPIGLNTDLRPLALLGFAAGMILVIVLVMVWSRGR